MIKGETPGQQGTNLQIREGRSRREPDPVFKKKKGEKMKSAVP